MLPVDLTEGMNNATYHTLLYMMVMIFGNVLKIVVLFMTCRDIFMHGYRFHYLFVD
jgi:hypothetical protein